MTAQSDVGTLRRVAVRHAREAFGRHETIARDWRALNYTAPPDFGRAAAEYDCFLEALGQSGAEIHRLPAGEGCGLDSIYVRDAAVVCDRGVILARMGKPLRAAEPDALGAALEALGYPVLGRIEPPGLLEGGDVVWLDRRTVAAGCGYRTNAAGIAQLQAILADAIDELVTVPLPHWRGPGDVFHLMSMVSPVDRDLAVVYSPLLPVPFRQALVARGIDLVEVPDEELDSLGANVLAVAPRRCLMVRGNPRTRAALERAGAEVVEYEGREISLKGGGGPTCLTRPLARARAQEVTEMK